MKTNSLKLFTMIGFAVFIGLAILASKLIGYWQSFLINISTVGLSLSIGLMVVNHFLNLQDKRRAAHPLLRMIAPSITKFHNEFFIEAGRSRFGIPAFKALINAYETNRRDPKAFTPEQRDGLYQMIKDSRDQLFPVLDTIHEQLKEISFILGWSFSPKIMRDSLDSRLNISKLRNLPFDDSVECKLSACELLLDTDADTGGVMRELTSLLGLKDDQWLEGKQ